MIDHDLWHYTKTDIEQHTRFHTVLHQFERSLGPGYSHTDHREALSRKLRLKIDRIRKGMLAHQELEHTDGGYHLRGASGRPTAPAPTTQARPLPSLAVPSADPDDTQDARLLLRRMLQTVSPRIVDLEYAQYLQNRSGGGALDEDAGSRQEQSV